MNKRKEKRKKKGKEHRYCKAANGYEAVVGCGERLKIFLVLRLFVSICKSTVEIQHFCRLTNLP